ncbi:MAG: hypothetical protein ACRDXB_06225, partial [Actinomycetes bacterium]
LDPHTSLIAAMAAIPGPNAHRLPAEGVPGRFDDTERPAGVPVNEIERPDGQAGPREELVHPLSVPFHRPQEFESGDTHHGHSRLVLTPNTIDWQAEELLGWCQCHRLAGALHSLTGWDVVTVDARIEWEGRSWWPAHSAVLTPDGRVLDIFGLHTLDEAEERYRQLHETPVRHRILAGHLMPGDVVIGIDRLRGDPNWWAADGSIEWLGAVNHFARLLLRRNGYAEFDVHGPEVSETDAEGGTNRFGTSSPGTHAALIVALAAGASVMAATMGSPDAGVAMAGAWLTVGHGHVHKPGPARSGRFIRGPPVLRLVSGAALVLGAVALTHGIDPHGGLLAAGAAAMGPWSPTLGTPKPHGSSVPEWWMSVSALAKDPEMGSEMGPDERERMARDLEAVPAEAPDQLQEMFATTSALVDDTVSVLRGQSPRHAPPVVGTLLY